MDKKKRRIRTGLLIAGPVCAVCLMALAVFPALWKEEQKEIVTLRFLMFGTEPEGMDMVLEEFYRRTQEDLGIRIEIDWIEGAADYSTLSDMRLSSRMDYDLVFDAKWIHLYEMQEKGIYADLSPYLHNPDYPGLYGAFSEKALENNLINGQQCALPVFRTYGTGIPCIYYRKDLAQKYGILSIDSEENLEAYMQAILLNEPDMIPLVLIGTRGFYTFNPQSYKLNSVQARRIVYPITIGGITVVGQLDDSLTKVEAVGIMGDEESFSGFMEGLRFDFLIQRLHGYREWNRYCEEDVLNRKNQDVVFRTGAGGAYISTLDDYERMNLLLTENVEGASLGVYIINERMRDRQEHAIGVSYRANNYVCIPASSAHMEQTAAFLDWLFSSRENHDLFECGIEGIHWTAVGDNRYQPIVNEEGSNYLFPGYVLTWNPNYVMFPSDMPDDILAYKEYELQESSFYENLLADFAFDESNVLSQFRKAEQIFNEVWPALRNGLLEEPEEVLYKAMDEAKENGLDDIMEEVERQLQEYLDAKSRD